MPKTLLIMRHAKSDWSSVGVADHNRPLNKRGRRSAPLMGQLLSDQKILVDAVHASSAVRVQETLELMQPNWNGMPEVLTDPDLYLAPVESLLHRIEALNEQWNHVMFVGHNPGLGDLVCGLSQRNVEFPTAALAMLTTDSPTWRGTARLGAWELKNFWKPRDLEATQPMSDT